MEQIYSVSVDLPQSLYNQIIMLTGARGQTFNQFVVETLQTAIQDTWNEYDYPHCPQEPSPGWENKHCKHK